MKNSQIPVPLLLLFGLTAVAAAVFFLVFNPGEHAAEPDAPVRLRFVGADGEPRAGVQAMLGKNVAKEPILLPLTGADGCIDGTIPAGAYELRVYPKRLTTAAARATFRAERAGDPGAIRRVRFFVRGVEFKVGETSRIDVRLPSKAGY
jgi:hypothetical protein